MSTAEVRTTRLYRLRDELVRVCPVKVLPAGTILWLYGSRRTSLGTTVGSFSETYSYLYPSQEPGHCHRRWSPVASWEGGGSFTISMSLVEEYYP